MAKKQTRRIVTKKITKKSQKTFIPKRVSGAFKNRYATFGFVLLFAALGAYLIFKSFAATSPSIVCPIDGRPGIGSPYLDSRSGGSRKHAGVDIFVGNRTPIYASQDGTLESRSTDSTGVNGTGYGHYVDLVTPSYRFRYAHLNDVARGAGAVKAGDLIAYTGDTGSRGEYHLHYEIRSPNGKTFGLDNTLNPADSYNSCRSRTSGTTSSPVKPPEPVHAASGYKQIVGVGSNKCLDVYGGSTANSTPVDIYSCGQVAHQYWKFESDGTIRSQSSGKCLGVYGGYTANSTKVDMYDCVNVIHQKWLHTHDKTIGSQHTGKCMGVYGGYTTNSTHVDMYDCVRDTSGRIVQHQQWTIQ